MGYTLEITDASGTFVFPVTTVFPESIANQFDDSGRLRRRQETLRIRGQATPASPGGASLTFDEIDKLRNLALRNGPQTVVIKLDGVEKRNLNPSNVFLGPFIEGWNEIDSPGGKANHTRFTFTIRADLIGCTLSNQAVADLDRTVRERIEDDHVVQKIWTIRVRAKTLAEAEALAKSLLPDADGLTQDNLKRIDQNTFEATWTFDRRRSEETSLLSIRETMTVRPGGQPISPVRITGGLPILRRGQVRAWEITFDMTFRGQYDSFENAAIVLGSFQGDRHYGEENLDPTRSDLFQDPVLVDDVRGIYELRMREHYVFDDEPERPEHNFHNEPSIAGDDAPDVPPDGPGFLQEAC